MRVGIVLRQDGRISDIKAGRPLIVRHADVVWNAAG